MNKGLAFATPAPFAGLFGRANDRRRHQRVKVTLLGRYMLEDRREFPCQTIDMSPGGVALFAPVNTPVGSRVVAYLDELGRIEGRVARHLDNGFALAMNVPLLKREKLADQLTWLANRHALGMPEDRRHERIAPRNVRSTLKLADGREHLVKLLDISLSGAALKADVQPPMGTIVTVGQTPGRVVRHIDGGIAIEFLRLMPAETFGENVKL
jgi:hypothetical protein